MSSVYPNREVFAAAPLALVAVEVRFSDSARLRQQTTVDEVTIALEGRFPIAAPHEQAEWSLTPPGPAQLHHRRGVVLTNDHRTESLTIMSDSLTYETTDYEDFDDALDAVIEGCLALVRAGVRPALRRVGLRYIDEVRVPEPITDAGQWRRWVDARLVDHLDVGPGGVLASMTQAITTYDLGEGLGLNFRYAALSQGPIVSPPHLRRPDYASGPFFVFDLDGFREFAEQSPRLEPEVVRESLKSVHPHCGATFQRAITDEARELFRRDTR